MGNTRSEESFSSDNSGNWDLKDELSFTPSNLLEANTFSKLFSRILDRLQTSAIERKGIREELDLRAISAQEFVKFQAEYAKKLPQDPSSKATPESLFKAHYPNSFFDAGEFLGKNLSTKPSTISMIELASSRLKLTTAAQINGEKILEAEEKNQMKNQLRYCERIIEAIATWNDSKAAEPKTTGNEDYKTRLLPLLMDELLDSIHSLEKPSANSKQQLDTLISSLSLIASNFQENEAIPKSNHLVLSSITKLIEALHQMYLTIKLDSQQVRVTLVMIAKLSLVGRLLSWQYWSLSELLKTDNLSAVEEAFANLKASTFETSCKSKSFPIIFHKESSTRVPSVCPDDKYRDVLLIAGHRQILTVCGALMTLLELGPNEETYVTKISVEWEKECKPVLLNGKFWFVHQDVLVPVEDSKSRKLADLKQEAGINLPDPEDLVHREILRPVVKAIGPGVTKVERTLYIENTPIPGVLARVILFESTPSSDDPAKSTSKQGYRVLQFLTVRKQQQPGTKPQFYVIWEKLLRPFHSGEPGKASAYFLNRNVERYVFIGPKNFIGIGKNNQNVEVFDVSSGQALHSGSQLSEFSSKIAFNYATQKIFTLEGINQLDIYNYTNVVEFCSDQDYNLCHPNGKNNSITVNDDCKNSSKGGDSNKELQKKLRAEMVVKELELIEEVQEDHSSNKSELSSWTDAKESSSQLQSIERVYSSQGEQLDESRPPNTLKYPQVPTAQASLRLIIDCFMINAVTSRRIPKDVTSNLSELANDLHDQKHKYDLSVQSLQNLCALVGQVLAFRDSHLAHSVAKLLDVYLTDISLIQNKDATAVLIDQETLFRLREGLFLMKQFNTNPNLNPTIINYNPNKDASSGAVSPWYPETVSQDRLFLSVASKLVKLCYDLRVFPWRRVIQCLFSEYWENDIEVFDSIYRAIIQGIPKDSTCVTWNNAVYEIIQTWCVQLIQQAESLESDFLRALTPDLMSAQYLHSSVTTAQSWNLKQSLTVLYRQAITYQKESFSNKVFLAGRTSCIKFLRNLGTALRRNDSLVVDTLLWQHTVMGSVLYRTIMLSLFDDVKCDDADTASLVDAFMEVAEQLPASGSQRVDKEQISNFSFDVKPSDTNLGARGIYRRIQSDTYSQLTVECKGQEPLLDTVAIFTVHETDNWNCGKDDARYVKACVPYKIIPVGSIIEVPSNDIIVAIMSDMCHGEAPRSISVTVSGSNKISLEEKLGLKVLYRICSFEVSKRLVDTIRNKGKAAQNQLNTFLSPEQINEVSSSLRGILFSEQGIQAESGAATCQLVDTSESQILSEKREELSEKGEATGEDNEERVRTGLANQMWEKLSTPAHLSSGSLEILNNLVAQVQEKAAKTDINGKILGDTGTQIMKVAFMVLLRLKFKTTDRIAGYLNACKSEGSTAQLQSLWRKLTKLRAVCRQHKSTDDQKEFFKKLSLVISQKLPMVSVESPHSLETFAEALFGFLATKTRANLFVDFVKVQEELFTVMSTQFERAQTSTDDPTILSSLLHQVFTRDVHGILPLGQEFCGLTVAREKSWSENLTSVFVDVLQKLIKAPVDSVSAQTLTQTMRGCCWEWTAQQADQILNTIDLEKLYANYLNKFESSIEAMQSMIQFVSLLARANPTDKSAEKWLSIRLNGILSDCGFAPASAQAEDPAQSQVAKQPLLKSVSQQDWFMWVDSKSVEHFESQEQEFLNFCQKQVNAKLLGKQSDQDSLTQSVELLPAEQRIDCQPELQEVFVDNLEARRKRNQQLLPVTLSSCTVGSHEAVKSNAEEEVMFGGLFDESPEQVPETTVAEPVQVVEKTQATLNLGLPISESSKQATWALSVLSFLLQSLPSTISTPINLSEWPPEQNSKSLEDELKFLKEHYYECLFTKKRSVFSLKARESKLSKIRSSSEISEKLAKLAQDGDAGLLLALEVVDSTPAVVGEGQRVRLVGDQTEEQYYVIPKTQGIYGLQYIHMLPLIHQDIKHQMPSRSNPPTLNSLDQFHLLMCARTGAFKFVGEKHIEPATTAEFDPAGLKSIFKGNELEQIVQRSQSDLKGLLFLWRICRIVVFGNLIDQESVIQAIFAKIKQLATSSNALAKIPQHILNSEIQKYLHSIAGSTKSLQTQEEVPSKLLPSHNQHRLLKDRVYKSLSLRQTPHPVQRRTELQQDFNTVYYPVTETKFNNEFLLGIESSLPESSHTYIKKLLIQSIWNMCRIHVTNPLRTPLTAEQFTNQILSEELPAPAEHLHLLNPTSSSQKQLLAIVLNSLQDSKICKTAAILKKYVRVAEQLITELSRETKDPELPGLKVAFGQVVLRLGCSLLSQGINYIQSSLPNFQLFLEVLALTETYISTLSGQVLPAEIAAQFSKALTLILNKDKLSPLSVAKFRRVESFSSLVFYFCRKVVQYLQVDNTTMDAQTKDILQWLLFKNQHFEEAASPLTSFENISIKGILIRALRAGKAEEQNKWKITLSRTQRQHELAFLKEYPHWIQLAQDKIENCQTYSLGIYLRDEKNPQEQTWFNGVNLERTNSPVMSIATRFSTPVDVLSGEKVAIARQDYSQNFINSSGMVTFDTPLLNRRNRDFKGAWGGCNYFIVDNCVHSSDKDGSIVDINAVPLWKDNKGGVYYKTDTKQLVIAVNNSPDLGSLPHKYLLDSERTVTYFYLDCSDKPEIVECLFVSEYAAVLVRDVTGVLTLYAPEYSTVESKPADGLAPQNPPQQRSHSSSVLISALSFLFEQTEPNCWSFSRTFIENSKALYKLTHVSDPDHSRMIVLGLQSEKDARVVIWEDETLRARVLEFKDQTIQRIITYSDLLAVLFASGKIYTVESMKSLTESGDKKVEFVSNPVLNTTVGKINDIILIYRSAIVGIEEVDDELETKDMQAEERTNYFDFNTKNLRLRFKLLLGSSFNYPYEYDALLTPQTRFVENSTVDSREIMLINTRPVRNVCCNRGTFMRWSTLCTPALVTIKPDTETAVTFAVDKLADLQAVGKLLKTPFTFILLNLFNGGLDKGDYWTLLKEYSESKVNLVNAETAPRATDPPTGTVAAVYSLHKDYSTNAIPGLVWLDTLPENFLDLEQTIKDPVYLLIPDEQGFRKGLDAYVRGFAKNLSLTNLDGEMNVHFLPDFDQMTAEEFSKLKAETESIWKPCMEEIAPLMKEYHKYVMDVSWKCVENSRSSRSTLRRFLCEARNFSDTEEYNKFAEVLPKDFKKDPFSIMLGILRMANYYYWEWLAQAPIHQGRCYDSKFIADVEKNAFGVNFLSQFKILSRENQAHITMNRVRGRYFSNREDPQMSLLLQLANRFDEETDHRLSKRRDLERIKMNLVGEGSNDAGGPRREIFEEICTEVTNILKILTPSANNLDNVGDERDKFGPNILANSQYDEHLLYSFGMMLASALVTGDCLPISFPTVVWKILQYQPASWKDYPTFGFNQAQSLEYIEGLSENQLAGLEAKLTFSLGDGTSVELIPGGASIPLTTANRAFYVSKVRSLLTGYLEGPVLQLRRGFETVIGRGTTSLVTAFMLERYVCGMEMVTVQQLKDITVYKNFDGKPENNQSVVWFWNILSTYTPEEMGKYLKYVWGRSRLGYSLTNHRMTYVSGKNDMIPETHTCFFEIDIFDYSSEELFRTQLNYGLNYSDFIVESSNTVNLVWASMVVLSTCRYCTTFLQK